ncbi:hypothetical protein [Pseudoalteromonas spongiae]|uniref:ORC-CDC6 family AAA ATPase n=1 Tax=Pseudoalteromonas spongiae TaxID=298657 RepID=UPI000C2D20D3|nr:hypothetical protein [Pseudoalteromonas spongiae]
MENLNLLVTSIAKRAERNQDDYLVKSFVPLEHTFSSLCLNENQFIYGRRGTGKTHLLKYLYNHLNTNNAHAVSIDMRLLGSSCGIYSESQVSVIERSSRLFCDLLCVIHEELSIHIQEIAEKDNFDYTALVDLLDSLIELATNISIVGDKQLETSTSQFHSNKANLKAGAKSTPIFHIDVSETRSEALTNADKVTYSGTEIHKIHLSSITKVIKEIVRLLPDKRVWILIDEWSEIPQDLQPYIADMIKRTLFGVPAINVKIAAIEHRSNLRSRGSYSPIGIEVSADASSSINLDEFMVFDKDKDKAMNFFGDLIYKHCLAMSPSLSKEKKAFILELFASNKAFEEFVRASEGIPRDALHIISHASQHSPEQRLNVIRIRESAQHWYQTNKSKDVNANAEAIKMLDWIINKVIGQRLSRGFLVKTETKNDTLDFLYDARILHLIKMGVSAKSHTGKRFNLYALDYGCYSDLLTTKAEPKGLLTGNNEYIDIPKIDFRSIKDSILDVTEYAKSGCLPLFASTEDLHLQAKLSGKLVKEETHFNSDLINNLSQDVVNMKIKNTVYIPIIFIGLVIRTEMGFNESSGTEITNAYNDFFGSNGKKKPNNISRALRDNDSVMNEPWLIINATPSGTSFSLCENWKDYWNDYFATTCSFDF